MEVEPSFFTLFSIERQGSHKNFTQYNSFFPLQIVFGLLVGLLVQWWMVLVCIIIGFGRVVVILSIYLSIYILYNIYLSVYHIIYLYIYLSIYIYVYHLYIYLSYLFIFPTI